jgi:hypothetical protein
MAANLKFRFLVDDAGLKKGVKNAKNQLTGFEKATKKASSGIKSALGGIGIAVGIGAIATALKQATQAAVEDNKSQALLANTLRNVTKASDEQIVSIEKRLGVMQTELAIADDQLRPAYSSLVNVLGDTDQAMAALSIAADVSAGTGKSLETVTAALSKAFAGNIGALNKLVPATKGAADPIAKLQELFGGAAKTAADADPYQRLQIIFGEIAETIGNQLLPLLQQFSAYLATPEGQAALENIVQLIVAMVQGLVQAVDWLGANIDAIKTIALAWGGVLLAIKAAELAMGLYSIATVAANGFTKNLGTTLKKSGWLAIALMLASMIDTSALTGDVDFGDQTTPTQTLLPSPTAGLTPQQQEYYRQKELADLLKKLKAKPAGSTGVNKALDETTKRMKAAAEKMQQYAKSFRESVDLAFGLNENETRFSAEKFIRQLKRVTEAAKKLPALLRKIRDTKATGSTALVNELSTMNPLQAATIAEGLLSSGKLNEIGSLRNQLSVAGQQTALVGAGAKTYNINVNKANMSAAEIIAAIKAFERSTGKKVLLG